MKFTSNSNYFSFLSLSTEEYIYFEAGNDYPEGNAKLVEVLKKIGKDAGVKRKFLSSYFFLIDNKVSFYSMS